MTLEQYIEELTNPLAMWRVTKEVVEKNRDYFVYMYNKKIGAIPAIWLMEDVDMRTFLKRV